MQSICQDSLRSSINVDNTDSVRIWESEMDSDIFFKIFIFYMKRVCTQFFCTTRLNAINKIVKRASTRVRKKLTRLNACYLLTAFKRVSDILSVALGWNHISEHVSMRAILASQIWFYSKNYCSRRVRRVIEIFGWHIFYLSKLR